MPKPGRSAAIPNAPNRLRDPEAQMRRGQAAGAELARRMERAVEDWNRKIGVSGLKVIEIAGAKGR